MHIEVFNWKKSQPLADAYIHRLGQASVLFESHYDEEKDWERRAERLHRTAALRADRSGLVRALSAYNQRIGNAAKAQEAISLLEDSQTLVVVGGQQAGIFGGPLLVVYKAITLLQLSKQWSAKLGRAVVPIFWIAGEDHDYDEVNHIYYLSSAQTVNKLKVEHPTGQRTSVSKLALSEGAWEEAIEALEETLMDTEFKAGLLEKLKAYTKQPCSLTDVFAKFMGMLFGEYGLVFMDSDDPNIRLLEAPMFNQLIQRNEELASTLLQGKEEVEAAGYVPQAGISADAANLFIYEDGQRLLLHRHGDRFMDKKKGFSYTRKELLEISQMAPDQLSNNVMTRPLMQEYLFPVLATVLGPGEIAYWALTKEAFRLFGMQMPIVAPRLEFTLVEGTVQKHMGKYNLTFEDIIYRFEDKKQAWLDAQDTLGLSARFEEVKAGFCNSYGPLVDSLGAINPGLKKLGETNMAKILEQIEFLETKAAEARKTTFDTSIRQLDKIRQTILPLAKPQERVYNVCAYLNRFGDGWLKELAEAIMPIDGLHRIYYL